MVDAQKPSIKGPSPYLIFALIIRPAPTRDSLRFATYDGATKTQDSLRCWAGATTGESTFCALEWAFRVGRETLKKFFSAGGWTEQIWLSNVSSEVRGPGTDRG